MFIHYLKPHNTLQSIRFRLYVRSIVVVAIFGLVLWLLSHLGWEQTWVSLVLLGMLLALLLVRIVVATLVRVVTQLNTALTVGGDGQYTRMSETNVLVDLLALVRHYNHMHDTLTACQHDLQDQLRRTALLTQVALELHESLDPSLLVNDILRAIVANTDVDHASIILANRDGRMSVASRISNGEVAPIAPERAQLVLEDGLAGWVLRYGRNVSLSDVRQDPRWAKLSDLEAVRSAMAIPLTFHNDMLGVLTITHPLPEQFASKDLLLLAGVAAQAGMAISSAQRHAEERRRQEQAVLLFSMSQFLTAAREPQDLAAELLEKSGAVFESYSSALFLVDTHTDTLNLFAIRAGQVANDDDFADALCGPMEASAQRAWQQQVAMTIAVPWATAHQKEQHQMKESDSNEAGTSPHSGFVCVAVPLLHNGVAIGAFVLVTRATGTAIFPARVWSLLTIFTNVAAAAFANRQLVEQLQQRAALLDQQVAERTLELQRSYDLVRIVFDYLPDGLVLVDAHGKILSANDAWCQGILGLQSQSAIGRQYVEIIQEVERGISLTIEWAPSTSIPGRVRCTLQDGHQRWYTIDRYTVGAGVAHEQVIERWRDVTLQEALQQRLLLQEQLTSLGRLATSVVHEIGNPLQSVQCSLELCLEDPGLPAVVVEYLELATGELYRIVQALDRLRELYRAPDLAWAVVDLNLLISAIQPSIIRQLRAHQITLELALMPNLPRVYAQPDALRQVIINLLLNAQAAMPGGGTIWVSTDVDPARRMSSFSVVDTGAGMSAEQLVHIFEPFQSQNVKPGLGLYLSHLIVQQHRGDILLTSDLGTGTSVVVYIPWSEDSDGTSHDISS